MKYFAVLLAVVLSLGLMMGCAQKPPTLTKVDPAMASSAGGTEITITGTGFKATPAPTVTIGGNPATGVKVTLKTTLKATVPPGMAGPADIVVTNSKAKVKSLAFKGFTYYEDVAVTMSNPDPTTAPPEGIDAPAKVSVTFNQDVEPASVAIKVAGADGVEVAGTPAQDTVDTKTFDFTPTEAFKAGDYTVTVSGAKGVTSGVAMPADYSMTFKVKEAAKAAKKSAKKGK
jgi:methionine-rich copper-binding protein CopC